MITKKSQHSRVLDKNGVVISSTNPDEVGKKKIETFVNPQGNEGGEEPLLPTDQQNKKKPEKQKKKQTNRNSTRPLYPLNTVKNSE